jgi:hypothetical protein
VSGVLIKRADVDHVGAKRALTHRELAPDIVGGEQRLGANLVGTCHFLQRLPESVASEPTYDYKEGKVMAKTIVRAKRVVRRDWTRAEIKELKQHSKRA